MELIDRILRKPLESELSSSDLARTQNAILDINKDYDSQMKLDTQRKMIINSGWASLMLNSLFNTYRLASDISPTILYEFIKMNITDVIEVKLWYRVSETNEQGQYTEAYTLDYTLSNLPYIEDYYSELTTFINETIEVHKGDIISLDSIELIAKHPLSGDVVSKITIDLTNSFINQNED